MAGPGITIRHGTRAKGMPDASIQVTINIKYGNDAPPALVEAVGRTIAQMLVVLDNDALMEDIAGQIADHQARRQREADHVARQLLGEDEP